MTKYDKIFESLQSKVTSGELTIEAASVLNDIAYDAYVQEGALSPLKDKVAKIKEIKDAKPDEYDGPEEVKAFVDKNFTDIVKVTELLQKEPDELSKNEKKYAATVAVSMITFIAGMITGVGIGVGIGVGLIGYFTLLISTIVYNLVTDARAHDDTEAMKNLSKIKTSLKKVNKDKLPDEYKKKISKMIQDIDDAETDIYAELKKVSESAEDTYNTVFEVIQESFDSEEMTEEEANDWNNTAYEKCFTTTESVDDLKLRVYEAHAEGIITEAEKDTYLEYLNR